MAGRLDSVKIATPRGVFEISWAERNEIIERMGLVSGFGALHRAFRDVGTTRPVELGDDDHAQLCATLEAWAQEDGGPDALPVRVRKLYDALAD